MPTLAHQHRIRAAAIGKKGGLESALLMESEVFTNVKQRPVVIDMSASPTTVASTFDLNMMPVISPLPGALEAIKPFPGAWVVVGKGGRPLKDGMMYDAPSPKQKKKKHKKKNRPHKAPDSDNEFNVLADLAEAPSTSTCERMLRHSTTRRQKEASKQKELKYWAAYRQEKATKTLARDMLIYVLANEGMLGDETDERVLKMVAPESLPRRHDKGSSQWSKLRRQARFASAAARCYSDEETEWSETLADIEEREPSIGKATAAAQGSSSGSSERWSLDADMLEHEGEAPPSSSWVVPTSWAWTRVLNRKGKRDSKNCSVA